MIFFVFTFLLAVISLIAFLAHAMNNTEGTGWSLSCALILVLAMQVISIFLWKGPSLF